MQPPLPMRLAAALALSLTAGCIEDLDPKDLVVGPRILDVMVDRPELNPGQSATFRAVLAGVTGTPRFRWFSCVSSDATRGMGLTNFGESNTFSGCYGDGLRVAPLGNGPTATLATPANALDSVAALAARFGNQLPPGLLEALARDIGLVIGVSVEVEVDGVTLKGYKRVVVSANPHPNTNPPPPRVRVNNTWVTLPSGEDSTCAAEDGSTIRLHPNQSVTLVPDPDEARWLEGYRVLTASGQLVDRQEKAFYSWYVTGGRVSQQLTRTPTRNNAWTTPARTGDESLWVFVRDGHGGTSGCRLPVRLE